MACFLAPTTVAIIVAAAKSKIPSRLHVEWLLALLIGGVAWLIPEHIYHGEVVFSPPFFTAGIHHILPEILRVGIPMTIAAIVVWLAMLASVEIINNKKHQPRFIQLAVLGAVLMVLIDKVL